jgi:hypothetical protein
MPTRLISAGAFVLAVLAGLAGARVDLGGGHMGLAMARTSCSGAHRVACTELDDDWPDMGLACPLAHHDIPRHTLAMMSATIIQLGHYKPVPVDQFPSDQCYTTPPNATVSSYGFISQGSFDMCASSEPHPTSLHSGFVYRYILRCSICFDCFCWIFLGFFAHDKCDCEEEQMPKCGISATEKEKCNLRTSVFFSLHFFSPLLFSEMAEEGGLKRLQDSIMYRLLLEHLHYVGLRFVK